MLCEHCEFKVLVLWLGQQEDEPTSKLLDRMHSCIAFLPLKGNSATS